MLKHPLKYLLKSTYISRVGLIFVLNSQAFQCIYLVTSFSSSHRTLYTGKCYLAHNDVICIIWLGLGSATGHSLRSPCILRAHTLQCSVYTSHKHTPKYIYIIIVMTLVLRIYIYIYIDRY